jgi:hypothetical protein
MAPSIAPCGWRSLPRVVDDVHGTIFAESAIAPLGATDQDVEYDLVMAHHDLPVQLNRSTRSLMFAAPSIVVPIREAMPHNTERWKAIIFEYYIIKWTMRPSAADFQTDILVQRATIDRVEACLASKVHMYALAAAVSTHMRSITGTVLPSIGGAETSPEFYIRHAIQGLRAYFLSVQEGSTIDPQILVNMMDLFRTEFCVRRINAGIFHAWINDALIGHVYVEQSQLPACHQSWNLYAVIAALQNHSPRLRTL